MDIHLSSVCQHITRRPAGNIVYGVEEMAEDRARPMATDSSLVFVCDLSIPQAVNNEWEGRVQRVLRQGIKTAGIASESTSDTNVSLCFTIRFILQFKPVLTTLYICDGSKFATLIKFSHLILNSLLLAAAIVRIC